MYKIISTSKAAISLSVTDTQGNPVLVNLPAGKSTFSVKKTEQIANMELNGLIKVMEVKTKNFSLGTAKAINLNFDSFVAPAAKTEVPPKKTVSKPETTKVTAKSEQPATDKTTTEKKGK